MHARSTNERRHPAFVSPLRYDLPALDVSERVYRRRHAKQVAEPLVDPFGNRGTKHIRVVGRAVSIDLVEPLPAVVRGIEAAHVRVLGIGVVPHSELQRGVPEAFQEDRQGAVRVFSLEHGGRKSHVRGERQTAGEQRDERAMRTGGIRERVLKEQRVLSDALEKRRRGSVVSVGRQDRGIETVCPQEQDIRPLGPPTLARARASRSRPGPVAAVAPPSLSRRNREDDAAIPIATTIAPGSQNHLASHVRDSISRPPSTGRVAACRQSETLRRRAGCRIRRRCR